MPNTPSRWLPSEDPDEHIVISGIAGRFPDSDNMKHFEENLLNKVDLISNDDRRWKLDHPEIPQRTGKINNVGKFDALFFGVHFKQAHTMDPMCRMLLEHTFEALIDAGVNPRQLRGTKTGVFIGACFSESEKTWFYEKLQVNGFGITGCSRAMLANRISYWLNVNGPSYTVDSACSSSLFAMENAYRAIRDGLCDAAIVGGANLCLHPYVSLQFSRLGVLSPDGKSKSFDADADGYCRSETIGVVFLQKAKDAKRVYAKFVHAKINCDGYKDQGITFPSSVMQSTLLEEFYVECGLSPLVLNFIEAHGTGTKVGDPEELNALDKVFCKGRKDPLLIGSIKSNLGHSEPASGICSIAKVILSMEGGKLLPNLHYKRPREGVRALAEERIKVVSEVTPWQGGYVGVNSFGFGGANAHILLKSNPKEKINAGAPKDALPRVVCVSGRTEEAVNTLLTDVESRPVDVEYISLLHDVFSESIPGHLYRGYTILPPNGLPDPPIRDIQNYQGAKRPIWFVFSGMGSQWAGMGESLMQLPVFAKAIRKCDTALKPKGLNIIDIITTKNKSLFDNILNSFVGIAAVQIGLVDVLHSIGIEPDNIIGHSVGELGCAYADGCFTAEQMILSAYSRGLASIETELIKGSMAAVGLGYQQLKDMCPPDIEIACHNGPESSTISGPAESMRAFVAKLQANNIFAREVPCSNIAYHSRYIAQAGPKLLSYLKRVIVDPKPRSSKWLSTSVPKNKCDTPEAKLCSAEYHTNNLLSPVLFEETAMLIPKDAITIEIAPHGLLQAILRRSLPQSVINVGLTLRGHKDNVEVLCQALGKLYNAGLSPKISNLYPKIEYPVSRGTRMISPLIKWEHSDDWYVTSYRIQDKIDSGERTVEVTLADEDFEYMAGHVIDGRNLLPATGYLALVWETVGMMRGELFTEFPIVFEDVKFLRATTIPAEGSIQLVLMITKGTGRFEVVEGGTAVVTGVVRVPLNPQDEMANPPIIDVEDGEELQSRDVYKELRLRGYYYSGLFRSLKRANLKGTKCHIAWVNNWVAFMDNMLQLQILGKDTRGLFVPTGIQKLAIDPKQHLNELRQMSFDNREYLAHYNPYHNIISAGGIEIRGLKASAIARRKPAGDPVLEEYKFIAHYDHADTTLRDFSRMSTQIALENHLGVKVKTIEILDERDNVPTKALLSPHIQEALGDVPLIQSDVNIVTTNKLADESLPANITITDSKKLSSESNALLGIGHYLLSNNSRKHHLDFLLSTVKENGFIVTRETPNIRNPEEFARNLGLGIVLVKRFGKEIFIVLKKLNKRKGKTLVIKVNNDRFDWLDEMKKILSEELSQENFLETRVILVGQTDFENGLLGLVNCIRKEPGGEIVRGILIQDPKAPKFSLTEALYKTELDKDLGVLVLSPKGLWGSYRHIPLSPVSEKPVRHVWANQLVRGDLSTFSWFEGPIQLGFKHKDLVEVHYSAINFRDVMLATGKLATEVVARDRQMEECVLGFEFVGYNSKGKRIMGLLDTRAMSNLVIANMPELCWDIPDSWSFEDACTVPCIYATCYYAMFMSGNMKKGEKILIHAGTGGIGQAAINLALHEGCKVFTTVGTAEKRKFIREHFPQIPDDHIGNSRDCSFEQMIMEITKGQGVDLVLNSLAEEKLLASIRCLGHCGRFLEIGKFDIAANNSLGMECFMREVSFHGIMMDKLFYSFMEKKFEVKRLLDEGLKNGAVKPIVRIVFAREQLEDAIRYMAGGKHIGKVIIKVRDENPSQELTLGKPRFSCLQDRSYIILGGLGGFGMELADWMVLRGCRNLILTSRSGVRNGYQKMRIKIWESYGTKVRIVVGKDASIKEDCKYIIDVANRMAPVDGIFNLAVILKDGLWENQTPENFEESFRAKAWSTKQLDILTREQCPVLRYFVVFSSVSCGRGNAGQSNYGMSNSVMERICEKRVADGLPGLAVEWGAVGDVGLVADMQEDNKELVIAGTLQQKISSCLQELDSFLQDNRAIVGSMVVAEKRAAGSGMTDIVTTVANIMSIKDLKTVSMQTSLAEMGMDSMMAVEIKQTLEREFEIFLTAQDIRSLNFAKLHEIQIKEVAENSKRENKTQDEMITGMKLLVRILGTDDLKPEICLKLNTQNDESRNEVFFIPGIEGLGSVFSSLAARVKSPATCLQLGLDEGRDSSMTTIAKRLLPYVLRNTNQREFVLVGYSFGASVVIELARQLETEGRICRLVLIDGAPDQLKMIKDQQLNMTRNINDLETSILAGIMDMFDPSITIKLVEELSKCKSWSEKLNVFSKLTPTEAINIPMQDQLRVTTSVYHRILALEAYEPEKMPKLRTPITLLKPKMPSLRNAEDDYGLRKLTKEKLEIYTIEGNHQTILDNPKVAKAINGDPLEDADSFKASIFEQGKIITPIKQD